MSDRAAPTGRRPFQVLFIVCLLFSAAAVLVGVLGVVAGETAAVLLGIVVLGAWLWLGGPLHLALLAWTLVRTVRGERAGLGLVWAYLAILAASAGTLAVGTGLTAPLAELLEEQARFLTDRHQVRLERGVRRSGPDAVEDVRSALAAGADANGTLDGMPVLVRAALRPEPAKIRLLLDAGADPDAPAPLGMSTLRLSLRPLRALEAAALSSTPEGAAVLDLLLDAGADPTLTALAPIACAEGDAQLHERAVRLGAGLREDAEGNNCLHLIAEFGHVDLLPRIAAAGDDPDRRNHSGLRPLDYALMKEEDEIALAILDAGGRPGQPRRVERALAREDDDAAYLALRARLGELGTP